MRDVRAVAKSPKQLQRYTEALVARSDKGLGTKHGQKPISVMLPPDLDEWVRSLDNRSEWVRQAIIEKLEREKHRQISA